MEKYVKDGMVAVLISPGYGAGWSTGAYEEDERKKALFHPKFVQAALDGVKDVDEIAEEVMGSEHFYTGGWKNIQVVWLPEGTAFLVKEYDGYESMQNMDAVLFDVA